MLPGHADWTLYLALQQRAEEEEEEDGMGRHRMELQNHALEC